MTFVDALKAARVLIADGSYTYICYALFKVSGGKYAYRIMGQLDGCDTYISWMERFHPSIWNTMAYDDFRDGRLQWIDHLISEEEKKCHSKN